MELLLLIKVRNESKVLFTDTKLLRNTDERTVGINNCNMRDKIKTMCLLVHCVLFKNACFVTWQPH